MSIVNRCMRVIDNQPTGVTWARLNERIDLLAKATKREKTQVFQHLKGKSNIWTNEADDMSDTIFMLTANAPQDVLTETSTTTVSATATAKKERLKKHSTMNHTKDLKVEPVTFTEPESKVVRMPGVNPAADVIDHPTMQERDIFAYNSFYTEDEVIAEMAYHVAQSEGHGLTLTALRMSVPEFSDCSDEDRYHLINRMRNRYGIQFYTKKAASGKEIKVLVLRREETEIIRPDWFKNQNREVRRHFPQESSGELIARTSGSVTNNAMAEAFAKLNPAQLFAAQAGSEYDEHDDDEDDSMYETDGELPEPTKKPEVPEPELGVMNRQMLRTYTHERQSATPTVATAAPTQPFIAEDVKPNVDQATYNADKGTLETSTPKPEVATVTKQEITQTADTLRLIADQLEAQAQVSEAVRQKKERFDVLMRMARESSVQIQTALDAHNDLLDNLQQAANDLTSL